ncbi:MAG: hypothetical protein IJ225_07240 [Solobacterium sp.]|nr:hypothetical protein [Solobacterium sp.]
MSKCGYSGKPTHGSTLWELMKFMLVSSMVSIIQLISVNLFVIWMRDWTSPLPGILMGIFSEETVGAGNATWGYVLPFFLSNLLANIYGFFQNRRTTFHSEAPVSRIGIYLVVVFLLILFSTVLQGRLVFWMKGVLSISSTLAPTLAAMAAGMVQFAVLFPLEKYVLFKTREE